MLLGCGANQKHEVIERTEEDVAKLLRPRTDAEVECVLVRDEHAIYASCDTTALNILDVNRPCGFAPLNTYECGLQTKS